MEWAIGAAALIVGLVAGYLVRRAVGEAKIKSAEAEAKRILDEAHKSGEARKRELLVEARDETQRLREELEKEIREDARKFNARSGASSTKRSPCIGGRNPCPRGKRTWPNRREAW
jgi:F0F1-type ATP synthase membrane subunit b/b'